MKKKLKSLCLILLIAIGCLQFVGYILKKPALRGLGIAYGIAPLPTVFSTINGVEGFATAHTIHFIDDENKPRKVNLNQHLFSRFKGHYFLKQAYSIFLAYPHVLKPCMVEEGLKYALCKRNIFYGFRIKNKIKNPSIQTERSRFNKMEHIILNPYCKE
ncbi:MAG: hypothetical protein ABIO81_06140 [Ginsengibacter sp.]